MTIKFFTLDGASLYAHNDANDDYQAWTAKCVVNYGDALADRLAADLSVDASSFSGLDEALQALKEPLADEATRDRLSAADAIRQVVRERTKE